MQLQSQQQHPQQHTVMHDWLMYLQLFHPTLHGCGCRHGRSSLPGRWRLPRGSRPFRVIGPPRPSCTSRPSMSPTSWTLPLWMKKMVATCSSKHSHECTTPDYTTPDCAKPGCTLPDLTTPAYLEAMLCICFGGWAEPHLLCVMGACPCTRHDLSHAAPPPPPPLVRSWSYLRAGQSSSKSGSWWTAGQPGVHPVWLASCATSPSCGTLLPKSWRSVQPPRAAPPLPLPLCFLQHTH